MVATALTIVRIRSPTDRFSTKSSDRSKSRRASTVSSGLQACGIEVGDDLGDQQHHHHVDTERHPVLSSPHGERVKGGMNT